MLFKKVPGQVDAVYTVKCHRVSVSFIGVLSNFNHFAASGFGRCSTIFVHVPSSYFTCLVNMRRQPDSIQMSRVYVLCACWLSSFSYVTPAFGHQRSLLSSRFLLAVFHNGLPSVGIRTCVHRVIPSGVSFVGELHDLCGGLQYSYLVPMVPWYSAVYTDFHHYD